MQASIIIRAYNASKSIERAIRSALAQDFSPEEYEILIINDGSTDGTASIVQQFLGDKRVRLISQDNKGIIGAANAGFESAHGDTVVLLDADDEALPAMVRMATVPFQDEAVDYTYPDYFEEYMGSTKLIKIADVFSAVAGGMGWRRRKLLAEGGFEEGTIFPEYDILLRTWGRWKGHHVQTPTLLYHRRTESIASDQLRVEASLAILSKKYPDKASEISRIRSYALPLDLIIRPATEKDAQVLFEWRNDEETRRQSKTSEIVKWEDHLNWLAALLQNNRRTLAIAEIENESVGTVRADQRDDGFTEISFTIAPAWRGKGIGKRMVINFVRDFLERAKIVAQVKKGHAPSESLARALGLSAYLEKPSENPDDSRPIVEWR
jgi:glycosyltransferase involved in cell wall biosynthesis